MQVSYSIDIEVLSELEKVCFPSSFYTLEQLKEMLEDTERYQVIVVSEEKELGYIVVFDNSESLEIMKIATLPEFRKRGVGKILVDEISKRGKDIFLEVRENNNNARKFYLGCGFEEIGKRKNYYPDTKEAAIIMTKKF